MQKNDRFQPVVWSTGLLLCMLLSGCATTSQISDIDPTERPLTLANKLAPSALKTKLLSCAEGPFKRTDFSIAHRGAPAGYPEHTREGYLAAAKMGAGVIECDVTFTKDLALVCRHSQCDLHRTTNILQTDLAHQCSVPFSPVSDDGPASATCCTSDITLAQFRSLCGRRDIADVSASTVDEYLAPPKSSLAQQEIACGTLMTHAESITLFDALGTKFTPELKSPAVDMPFNGMSQQAYGTKMISQYVDAGIDPTRVKPQSFNINDVLHWIDKHPDFAASAVYLDPRGRNRDFRSSLKDMQDLKVHGITTLAPPMPMLLTLDDDGQLQASDYARHAKAAGLELITWTFESGIATDPNNWLYANLKGFMTDESKALEVLHALQEQAGIKGIFSDWPGTVTYYANCFER